MNAMFTATQFPGAAGKESHTVVIGLDFGTSSSKVVLNNNSAGKSFAIPFDDNGHPSNRYLLPTRPYFDPQGKLRIAEVTSSIPLRELKSYLVGNTNLAFEFVEGVEKRANATTLAVGYLGRTIRLARSWFLSNQKDSFRHVKIDWHLNLGIPALGSVFDEKKALFTRIARAAWVASCQPSEITLESAEKAYNSGVTNENLENTDIHHENINVIPEVVAEIIGYTKSPLRKKGLHLLVDIGAGTLDITSVNLTQVNGEDRYPILTGDVRWYGGFELHKQRINTIKNRVTEWLNVLGKNEDPVKPLPLTTAEYLPSLVQLELTQDRSLDSEFFSKCKQSIHQVMHHLKRKKYPNAPEWVTGVTCFICGGGKNISFYHDVLKNVDQWYRKNGRSGGLLIEDLPQPEHLSIRGLDKTEYHRIAVAYGLSFPHYDVGRVIPPSEDDDLPGPDAPRDFTDDYISKDQM
jgi:hypothetical protein